jgi:hypothetical protein
MSRKTEAGLACTIGIDTGHQLVATATVGE